MSIRDTIRRTLKLQEGRMDDPNELERLYGKDFKPAPKTSLDTELMNHGFNKTGPGNWRHPAGHEAYVVEDPDEIHTKGSWQVIHADTLSHANKQGDIAPGLGVGYHPSQGPPIAALRDHLKNFTSRDYDPQEEEGGWD